MPRKTRPLDRDAGVVRDASLVVIASEDKYAVEQYFRRFRTRKVQFIVLATDDCHSSPQAVLRRLDDYKKAEATEEGDEFWICMDSDHWVKANHIQNLGVVLQQCRQKGYNVAISHPCFELWLLLHFADYTPPMGGGDVRCEDVICQLRRAAGAYKKERCDRLGISVDQVLSALRRAKALDVSADVLPSTPTSRVYKIVEILQARDVIALEVRNA